MIPTILISYVVLLFSLSVHEACHAGAAYLLDDDTAARMGRLTLNPLAHIDPLGTVVMPLLGLITGGHIFFGWAKPVPFDPRNLTRRLRIKVSAALISAAGPASNLVLSFIFMLVTALAIRVIDPMVLGPMGLPMARTEIFWKAVMYGPQGVMAMNLGPGLFMLLSMGGLLVILNLVLAVFNLLPLGPLDGAGVLGGFVPDRYIPKYNRLRYHPATFGILIVLLMLGAFSYVLWPFVSLFLAIYEPIVRIILGA
jgi:Zn-dependent protease